MPKRADVPNARAAGVLGLRSAIGNRALVQLLTHATDLGQALNALGRDAPMGTGRTPLVANSPIADGRAVAGATSGGAVHLGARAASLPAPALGELLAHEAAHVAQTRFGTRPAHTREIEGEAHELAEARGSRAASSPLLKPKETTQLESPRDKALVARAKRRAELLETFISEYYAREGRRMSRARESGPLRGQRVAIDDAFGSIKRATEETHFRRMNRRPLNVEVTADAVRFHIKFHVRFEGLRREQAKQRFALLETNFRAGVRQVWNQTLQGTSLRGRRFEVLPTFKLVGRRAKRDPDFWLISVRPTDTGPIEFEGTSLGTAPAGVPTSATDPLLGDGMMSLPPSHVTKPFTLAHELLHSFGLVDRYMVLVHVAPSGQRTMTQGPTRNTGGRPDPLGGQPGKILVEDLDLLFEKHGVYAAEETRGLRILEQLENTELMSIGQALGELERQREIIRTGKDPRSLIRLRTDFNDKILESARQL